MSIPEKSTCLWTLLVFSFVEKGLPLASNWNSQALFLSSLLFVFPLLFLLWGIQGSLKIKGWQCSSTRLCLIQIQHDSGEEGAKGRDTDSCAHPQHTRTNIHLYTDAYTVCTCVQIHAHTRTESLHICAHTHMNVNIKICINTQRTEIHM